MILRIYIYIIMILRKPNQYTCYEYAKYASPCNHHFWYEKNPQLSQNSTEKPMVSQQFQPSPVLASNICTMIIRPAAWWWSSPRGSGVLTKVPRNS